MSAYRRLNASAEQIARMRELRATGLAWSAIGARFGVSGATVRYIVLKTAGRQARVAAPHGAEPKQ